MPDINAGVISEALNNKVDIGYGNTSPKQPVTRQQITNCILEDPQNIKLELSNGTLTLKAGSVVIVPNGFESDGTTPKFDEVEIESDASTTSWGTMTMNNVVMVWSKASGKFNPYDPSVCFSGSTAPTGFGTHALWYDTVNNLMKSTGDSGTTWATVYCLPVALISYSSGTPTSIDQIFQSIGYIGSTVFVRKGLKVLIPNGKNDNGSLKNIEYTTTSVITQTVSVANNNNFIFALKSDGTLEGSSYYEYQEDKNLIYRSNTSAYQSLCFIIYCTIGSTSNISNFKSYTATNILKYSDISQISGWSMPSSKYIDLTLGATGTSYTAPANGYFTVGFTGTNGDSYFELVNNTTLNNKPSSSASFVSGWARCFIPVMKGDVMSVYYGGTNFTLRFFRFVYMQGETSS